MGPEKDDEEDPNRDPVRFHGLSVQRYRELYHSVLTVSSSHGRPCCKNTMHQDVLCNFTDGGSTTCCLHGDVIALLGMIYSLASLCLHGHKEMTLPGPGEIFLKPL
ncbi:hypothetical protein NQD34_004005 [Periophthalmus magnuspinnatus]|nr:hypothetical protein NQD34_004005 [Periophthalmus magnuspinnatus]